MNEINIFYEHSKLPIIEKNLKLLCEGIFNYKQYVSYNISIIFINDEKLKDMKKQYFNQNLYTDVIAFNLNDESEDLEGEVYLSFDAIKINSKLYKTNLNNEIKRVITHGILHLMGHKDSTMVEKNKMTQLEDFFINYFNDIKLL